MAEHEKLTAALTVKTEEDQLRKLRGVAEAEDKEAPEVVRMLIDHHLSEMEAKYAALDRIFGANKG